MTTKGLVASASLSIDAPADEVWDALVNPRKIKRYMFGTDVASEWKEGSTIVWRGEWDGKRYEDKGRILRFDPPSLIRYSHFSPLSGLPDIPKSYHVVTIRLSDWDSGTVVSLSQDNNPTEEARIHSERNWANMLTSLKAFLGGRTG